MTNHDEQMKAVARLVSGRPDWIDAPAVQAWHRSDGRTEHDGTPGKPRIWSPDYRTTERWSTPSLRSVHWSDLVDVVPLAAPAGSYTRTDEPRGHDYTPCTHETDSEHWQARAIKAERERDEARAELAKADAQIEELNKEAQTYSDALTEEIARAEKAERERDEVRDAWEGAVESVKEANSLINSLRAAESRPFTPDDITDEMVERAREEFFGGDVGGPVSGPSSARRWRAALAAALTEPTRPEGAEHWETWLSRLDYLHDETGASRADLATLANDLATEVALTPTNPEETP